jgi:multidrug efflux pump subunit AcrA (membrane-fusion protein)
LNKKIIIGIAAVLIIGGSMVLKNRVGGETPTVRLVTINNENISESLKFEGEVEAKKTYGLYKKVPMLIKEIIVKPGTYVEKGQELVLFSGVGEATDDMQNSSLSIQLEEKKLEVETLQKQLVELERREKVVKFQLENANSTAETMKELLKQDGVSSLEANKYITDASLKDLEYNNVLKDITLTREQLRIKSSALKEETKEMGENLMAPTNGIVTEVLTEPGRMTIPGQPIVNFASLEDGLQVKVLIPIYQSQGISKGANVDVISKGSLEEKRYKGKVVRVSNIAIMKKEGNREERYITATVGLDDSEGLLPGANVGVEIAGKELNGLNVVDAFSVIEENGKNYVYVVENGRARKSEVEVGVKTLSKYEILNLPLGTKVVVNPFKVRDGEKVEVKNR